MTDILVYTEEQDNVIAGSVEPREIVVAVVGEVGGGGGLVLSVNGQIGDVVLDADDVGADAAGTAAGAVAGHEAALDPHPQYTTTAEAAAAAPVQSVNSQTGAVVLSAADVGADPSGTAGAAVAAHESDTTPHAVITQVDKFGFDTAAGQTAGVGELVWNEADGTADLGLPGGVTLQVGQEQLIRVLNKTGSTIENMHVVYITGAQGNRVTAAQAQANNANADKTLAVATQAIADNSEGFATLQGLVRDIDTSAWTEGTELWLSATAAGAITNVRPSAPNHQVRVGYVVRSHASVGSIYVTVNIGADLSHLHDVVIATPADGDVLVYDATTQTWKNEAQVGLVESVNGQTGVVVLVTDDISEGVTNLYHTDARVRGAALTGLSLTTGAVAATDTVLQAFGKLEQTKAPLASPAFTGAPTAPTATPGSNTTQIATTAFVREAASSLVAQTITNGITTSAPSQDAVFDALALKAPLTSPTFTGTPAAPTPAAGDNGTKIATTAFVQTALLTPVAAYAGTAKTLALTDVGTIVDCTSSSAVTITIPPQSSVAWPDNTEIHVRMSSTGQVSIAVGSGVTVPPLTAPVALAGQGAVVTLKRRSADVWAIVGAATWMQPISTITGLQAELDHINITLAIGV